MQNSNISISGETRKAVLQLIIILRKNLLNRLLEILRLQDEEAFYALYLSQGRDLHSLEKVTGVPAENLNQCLNFVKQLLGPERVRKMAGEYDLLKEHDMFLGALYPESSKS